MQGPNAVLNTMTLPPGASQTQARLVLDGIRGAIFLYNNGGPVGALIGSWARSAGTDPYGNSFPQGLSVDLGVISGSTFEGSDFIINSSGAFFYSGTPGFDNLIISMAPTAGTDSFGNTYPQGFGVAAGAIPGTLLNDASVTPGKISALTASLLGNIGVLNANPYFTGGDGTGWFGFNGTFAVTSTPPAGAPFKFAGVYVNNGVAAGAMEESGDSSKFPVTPNTQYLVTAWVYSSVATVQIGFDWDTSAGGFISTSVQNITVPVNTWTQVTTVQTSAATAALAYARVGCNSSGLGATIYAQAVTVLPQVPGSLVQAGTVTATQIAAGTITAAKLAAGIVVAGIVDGTTITDNENLIYSPSPALGNLLFSIAGGPGTDSFGNAFIGGLVAYGSAPGIQFACQFGFFGIAFYNAPGPAGPWSPTPDGIQYTWNPTESSFDAIITAARLGFQVGNNPIGFEVNGSTAELTTVNTGPGNARIAEVSPGSGIITTLDESLTSTSGNITGNVTSPTLITPQFPTDSLNGQVQGATYTLKTWFNGTWGNQLMFIYADINGSTTQLCTIGAALGASGDSVEGWLELEAMTPNNNTIRLTLAGGIHDTTGNILPSNSAVITSTAFTGIAFTPGDTIALAIAFGASVAGQSINSEGSRFTRRG